MKRQKEMWGYEVSKRYELVRKNLKTRLTREQKLWKIKLFIFKNFNISPEEYSSYDLAKNDFSVRFVNGKETNKHGWFELDVASKNKLRLGSYLSTVI